MRIITNNMLNDSAPIFDGRYGFEWNKVTNSFNKTMNDSSGDPALMISDLEIADDLVSFSLEMLAASISYPVEILNKNNDFVVSLTAATKLTIRYFAGKVKYIEEFTIVGLTQNVTTTYKIIIDNDRISLTEDSTLITNRTLANDLKIWYQFDSIDDIKNYGNGAVNSLSVESNIGFIRNISGNVDIDYASPYTYYTFLGSGGFTVNSQIDCDMLMVGGGGMVMVSSQLTQAQEPTVNGHAAIVGTPYYTDYTHTIQQKAEDVTGVLGWLHIKHLPASSSKWYSTTDDLAGSNFGRPNDPTNEWSITYSSDKTELLLVRDGSLFNKWIRVRLSDIKDKEGQNWQG